VSDEDDETKRTEGAAAKAAAGERGSERAGDGSRAQMSVS
jgi:hypothetical protein